MNGVNVLIQWADPTDVGGPGNQILAFRVEIKLNTDAYQEELVNCNGTDSSIVANKQCEIPMSLMTTAIASGGLGFSQGQEIKARITAKNGLGWGLPGLDSTT